MCHCIVTTQHCCCTYSVHERCVVLPAVDAWRASHDRVVAAGIKESTEEAEDKGQPKTGLMGALLGRSADSGDDEARTSSAGSANGTSKESSLSQIGASVMGVEAAERESRPAVPAGMGPFSNPDSSNGRNSGNHEANSTSNVSASQGAGQTSPVVRSMILEKPPSFKVGNLSYHVQHCASLFQLCLLDQAGLRCACGALAWCACC